MNAVAIAELHAAFTGSFAELGGDRERDRDIVVSAWPTVPVEILRAAGFLAVLAHGGAEPTPAAAAELEAGVFPARLRHLVDAALTGRLAHVAAIVLPRTSDPDYKCFLYLREFARRGSGGPLPPVILFDLLHTRDDSARCYNRDRARALFEQLKTLAGGRATAAAVGEEIERANAARRAARRLQSLRSGSPRLGGAEAIPLLGAFWSLPPERYAALADGAADAIATRAPLAGPRVLLAGAPVATPDLSTAIESSGAVVVNEISPCGGEVAGSDIALDADPFVALADTYQRAIASARTPAALLRERIGQALAGIDAVVISLPPDDAVFGWDYPRLRALLDRNGIPHAVMTGDPAVPPPDRDRRRIHDLVESVASAPARRHG